MAYRNESWQQAFNQLNWLSVLGLMCFTVLSLTMLGITGEVVTLLETYPWLPFTGSLGAMVVIFLASGTRDPSMYHIGELFVVLFSLVLMGGYAFLVEVQDFVSSFDPWGRVVVLVLLLAASAVLAR